jgi:transposase
MEARLVERAKMVLGCIEGEPVSQIARRLHVRPNTVIDWRSRLEREGLPGLLDRSRPGKPALYGADFRKQVLELLEQLPPKGQAHWDGPAVADRLKTSAHAVWRVLRKEGVCLSRQRSWCVSTDREFTAKAADIVGLYLNPPENAFVIVRSDFKVVHSQQNRSLPPKSEAD